MKTTKVQSSVISEIGYDEAEKRLEVVFTNGARFQYANVPQDVYDAFIAAESVGKFFGAKIRNHYTAARQKPNDKAGD